MPIDGSQKARGELRPPVKYKKKTTEAALSLQSVCLFLEKSAEMTSADIGKGLVFTVNQFG